MNFLEIVNNVIHTTGVGKKLTTVENLTPDSDEDMIVRLVRESQNDMSRDLPQAPLFFNGNISTIDDEDVADSFASGTSSIQLTNGSNEITGTTTDVLTVDANWTGRLLHISGDSQWYRVHSVRAAEGSPSSDDEAGAIILSDMAGSKVNYRGTTDAPDDGSGKTVTISQDRYLLPKNFKRPISLNDFFGMGTLRYLPTEDYDQRVFTQNKGTRFTQKPEVFTIFSVALQDGKPRYWVEFDPIPDDVYHYHFRYEGSPSLMEVDVDVPGYPPEYEAALLFRARYYVYRYIKKTNDDAQIELAEYTKAIAAEQKSDVAQNARVQFQPMTSRDYWRQAYGDHTQQAMKQT